MTDLSKGGQPENGAGSVRPVPDVDVEMDVDVDVNVDVDGEA